jgi:GcrA cell cycle regulator
MSFRINDFWNVQRIERLELLWNEAWTCREIAADLGTSRCAVIGKVDRLGLPARSPKPRMSAEEAKRRRLERQRKYDATRTNRPYVRSIMTAEPIVREPVYEYLGIPFSQLRDWRNKDVNECRYIAGAVTGADVPACGNGTLPGASYCPHCTQAMKPAKYTMEERIVSHHMGMRRYQRALRRVA